jgi:hypothetical protein
MGEVISRERHRETLPPGQYTYDVAHWLLDTPCSCVV